MKVYRCHQVKAHELLSNELHALCRFITLSHQKKKKKTRLDCHHFDESGQKL